MRRGIFPLRGVSGPDVTLMSCSKLRCSGAGQLAVVCVYLQVGYMVVYLILRNWSHVKPCMCSDTPSCGVLSRYSSSIPVHTSFQFHFSLVIKCISTTLCGCPVFSAEVPTFKVWPSMASVLNLFIDRNSLVRC